jgi:hypothetical protein
VAARENYSIGDPRSAEIIPVEGVAAHSVPVEPADSELERGILDAMRLGLVDVAKTLASRLEGRRRSPPTNVIDFESRRPKR